MAGFALFLLWLQLTIPHERWLVVDRSGSIETFERAPDLTVEQVGRASSVWAWSARTAPRRVELRGIRPDALPVDAARLAVRVERRAPGRAPADLRLVAAPIEMWTSLPETVLPFWPVPADGRLSIPLDRDHPVRLRVLGRGEGSWWVDVPAGLTETGVATVPARGVDLQVLDPHGKPARPIQGTLQKPRGNVVQPWSGLRGEEGRIILDGLPDQEEISLLLRHPSGAPLLLVGRPSSLPAEARLSASADLRGRLLDRQGAPVAGAKVDVESWVSHDLPMMHRMRTVSDVRGRWRLEGLPTGRVALTLRAERFVPVVERFEIEPGERDLGDLRLDRGAELRIRVVDEEGLPVSGARIDVGPAGEPTIADARGVAHLTGLPQAPVEIRATARHFQPGQVRLNPPFPIDPELRLTRAFTLAGRIVDESGRPVRSGLLTVHTKTCSTDSSLGENGEFDVDLPPGLAGELAYRSPVTRELRVAIAPGAPGEVRDLGDLAAAIGRVVVGRVVRSSDGTAVAGARIWTTRQGAEGPDVAWATGDLLQASSGGDGRFALRGLVEGAITLRVEAPGFARSQLGLFLGVPAEERSDDDVGDVVLTGGARVRVRVDPEKVGLDGAIARVDLGNRWQDADLLTAQVLDGLAVISEVPAGEVTVTVLSNQRLLCERIVTILEGGEQEVECSSPAVTVSGLALIGGMPAGGGSLAWRNAGAESQSGLIQNHVSPGGLRQQQVAGLGRPQVDVAVGPDGRFGTDQLSPGLWQVSWRPEAGSFSGSVRVEIPRGERFDTVLPFDGLALAGRVTDAEGQPVEEARVRELETGAFALTGSDGSFVLAGLRPGKAQVQARFRDRTSGLKEVAIAPAELPEPILLVVDRDETPSITIEVVDLTGAAVPGAFVFLEQEGKGVQILSTATDGSAQAVVEAPLPKRVRAAAYAGGVWGFGTWATWPEAATGLAVALSGGGALSIRSDRLSGLPVVAQGKGWDVSWLLRQLGEPLQISSEKPLAIGGLPEGRYDVSLGSARISVEVFEGKVAEGTLD